MNLKSLLLSTTLLSVAAYTSMGQPLISIQPQDQTNYVGTTVTFTVEATGSEPVSYQWQKYSAGFADLPGRTNAALILTDVQTNETANYRVVVTDVNGTTNSAAAHLYVAMPETLLISQPASGLVTLSWQGNMVLLKAGWQSGSLDCAAWVRVPSNSPVMLRVGSGSQFFRLMAPSSVAEMQAAYATNVEACRAQNLKACEDCVAAHLLSPYPAPSGEAEEAASIGVSLGSCISPAQSEVLSAWRHLVYGP